MLRKVNKKAQMNKKFDPHLFRHTRITEWARQGFGDSEIKVLAGWTKASPMLKFYTHLTSKDVNRKMLQRRGLLDKKEWVEESKLEPKKCSRCEEINPATAKFCYKCSMALDLKTAMKLDEIKQEQTRGSLALIRILSELLNIPMVQSLLLKKANELGITQRSRVTLMMSLVVRALELMEISTAEWMNALYDKITYGQMPLFVSVTSFSLPFFFLLTIPLFSIDFRSSLAFDLENPHLLAMVDWYKTPPEALRRATTLSSSSSIAFHDGVGATFFLFLTLKNQRPTEATATIASTLKIRVI